MRRASFLRPLAAALLATGLLPATAGVIATNVQINFSEAATFASGIDRTLSLGEAQAARLVAERLGTWIGTEASFFVTASHGVSISDPGVAVAPGTARDLLHVTASASVSGGLLAASPFTQNLGATWHCAGTATRCTDTMVVHTLAQATPALAAITAPAQALQPWRLQASASAEPLFAGAQLLAGELSLSGQLRLSAQYQSKTAQAYVADALLATAGSAAPATAARWASAAADVNTLRSASWTDLAVDRSLQAARNPELETAQRLLTVARDSATLLQTGSTPGMAFATPFSLTRQLWNLSAQAAPALGRGLAGSTSDNLFGNDPAAELAVLQATLAARDDASFLAGLADALAHPAVAGSAPVLTLDGAALGLAGAQIGIYLSGDAFTGLAQLALPGAQRHTLLRSGYDRITLLEGPADGLTVLAAANGAGEMLRPGDGELYVGETFGGMLELGGAGAPALLQLNNTYGEQIMVVASWGVSAVPEPASAALLGGGALLLMRALRRRPSTPRRTPLP
ncbi:hypothetical protein AACH10_16045 [Ideonella sp. DXS22W]|uniref:PEP-CTERM protein-sorting domain-containing protein n=1 Tax=Pseudaquabacterium inlustre TaxID=2984192 RepID=A0ABU9CIT5_9BURK